MQSRVTSVAVALVAGAFAVAGCGGGAKAPANCPDGTVLKGADCVADDSSPSSDNSSSGASSGGAGGGDTAAGSASTYDKDAVEVQLKRAARQVKANCGSATDDSGQATGPWGTTKASVTLGRNGHVKQISVPAPYDGKPVGICIVHAFQKIQFPPYGGSTDVVLDWDVEVVKGK